MSFNFLNQLPTPGDTPNTHESDSQPSPTSYTNHSTTWTPVDGMTPISTNPSRKRSRDETAFEAADAEYFSFPSVQQLSTPAPIPEELVSGEGIVLDNLQPGQTPSTGSQNGMWYEEKEDASITKRAFDTTLSEFRPKMPASRKSIRLSQSSIRVTLDASNGTAPPSPPKSSSNPEIDEATLALGIGWTKLDNEDADLQAAARGWARYLENNYSKHIRDAEFLLKNRGLDAYLIKCQQGFFLFNEDLSQGQLVGTTWDTCLANLRSQPMKFEGSETLSAEKTSGSNEGGESKKEVMNNWADFDRINNPISGHVGLNSSTIGITTNGMDLD